MRRLRAKENEDEHEEIVVSLSTGMPYNSFFRLLVLTNL